MPKIGRSVSADHDEKNRPLDSAGAAQPMEISREIGAQTAYAQWLRAEGVDVVDARAPPDLAALELRPWMRRGGRAAFLQHTHEPVAADCYVCEIPPGQSLAPRRHLFEEIVLVLEGRGSTSFANDREGSQSFEWKAGTLFSVPLNSTYRHFNGSGKQRVRFVAVTTAPAILNAFADTEFVFGCRHGFGATTGVSGTMGDDHAGLDALDCPLMEAHGLGIGGHLRSRVGTRALWAAIAQLPPATYAKAQIYGPDAYTVVLAGQGYSLIWYDRGARQRWGWRHGALIASPALWWRQHFNPERGPLRCVTLAPDIALMRVIDGMPAPSTEGSQEPPCIDYAHEAADIRAAFAVALTSNGLESRMGAAYAAELGQTGSRS